MTNRLIKPERYWRVGPTARVAFLALLLLADPALDAKANSAYCGKISNYSVARTRLSAARQTLGDHLNREENCRAYRTYFYEAVTAREAASACKDGIDRQRDVALIDIEIDAFNDLLATQCSD